MTPESRNNELRIDFTDRRLDKHIAGATDTQATIKELPLLYNSAVNTLS
jgi:hypothetical protein